jgi:hypothetical protein
MVRITKMGAKMHEDIYLFDLKKDFNDIKTRLWL